MENGVYTIKEKEKPKNKRFLTIAMIVQAIIVVVQLVVYKI